ncbi:endochitinase, partial [Polychytrium aggregatum]|uniref:endochitinase n=1 Tax=Polychytrium aggregatum TaxID=110093 RepID=UPI0022FE44CF
TTTTPARTTTTTTTTPARTSTTTKAATSTTTTTTTPARTTTTTSSAGPAPTGTLPTCHQAWVAVWTYQGGSIVSYNNVDFKNSFYANAGDEPTKSNNWVSLGPCDPNGMPDGPGRDGVPTLAQARAFEASQTSSDLFQKIKRSIATLDNSVVEQVAPGKASNPPNVKRVEQIIPQSKWNYYFSVANPLYTYTGFLQAVAKFTAFCGDYSDGRDANAICKRSLAAMFSHFAQETGGHSVQQYGIAEWLQALVAVRENGCPESPGCSYNNGCVDPVWNYIWTCGKNPDGSFMNYFGRGAKQLTYFFNYAPFSQIMFNGDPTVLLNDPDRVATSWLNLASAVFFFVYPQPPKPSMLFVVDGTWVPNADDISRQLGNDFPTTIQIINSECQDSPTKAAAQNRINYYRNFTADLGIDISHDNLKCAGMGLFSGQSSAALFIYWDKADSPFTCKLVNYQTAFNALIDDQYVSCVEHKWNVTLK